jgi:membrane protein implicated in regulation of membrane protease activity
MNAFSENSALSWLVLGMVLVGLELFTGTFVVMFFSVGAFLTALIAWLGVIDSLPIQIVIFTLLSGGGLFYFRDKLKVGYKDTDGDLKSDVGSVIHLDSDVEAGAQTEVQYQGARWPAVNESGRFLAKGTSIKVAKVDGVTLILK